MLAEFASRVLRPSNGLAFLLPVLPGGIWLMSIVMALGPRATTLVPPIFGTSTMAVASVFAMYVGGVFFSYAARVVGAIVGGILGGAATWIRPPVIPLWKRRTWRRLVVECFGPSVTPKLELGPIFIGDQNLHELYKRHLDEKDVKSYQQLTARETADGEWEELYHVLFYVYSPPRSIKKSAYFDFSETITACALAGLIGLRLQPASVPGSYWAVGWLAFVLPLSFSVLEGVVHLINDPNEAAQQAGMLDEIIRRRGRMLADVRSDETATDGSD